MSSEEKFHTNGKNYDLYPPLLPLTNSVLAVRTESLRQLFVAKFNRQPCFYVRVPGRVNLIGEHIDYCGYSVCPMAIQQDIIIAIALSENQTLQLTNLEEKYLDFSCDINDVNIEINGSPEWHNYFLCGLKGVLETLPTLSKAVGILAAVTGNIPPNSGLSSSSALVSAAALATAHSNQLRMTKQEIATLAAKAEQYVGTQGGGMDQAIAFLGTKGCAKHIEFNPLRCEDIILPSDAVFVIAHSLAELNKASTSDFNCRVAECRLASQLLAKKSGLVWEKVLRLADLQKLLELELKDMISLVMKELHEEPYTKDEICTLLEVSEEELNRLSLMNNTSDCVQFKIKQRALHVFQEAGRVKRFREECLKGGSGDGVLHKLGDLMRKSHISLQQLYECSHPNLDQVVQIGEADSFGSRLTGAGWGGCVVALTSHSSVDKYIQVLKTKFYDGHPNAVGKVIDTLVFATEPYEGAAIYFC